MTKRIHPKSGTTYTFKQIVEVLYLRDSACLTFRENDMDQNIQDSHLSQEAMLALPHWADSRWTFRRETEEWVPVFTFSNDNAEFLDDLIDKEPEIDPHAERPGVLWCVPKGQAREQYHRIEKDDDGEYITSAGGTRYPLPVFDEHGKSDSYYFRVNNPGTCDYCKRQVEKRVNYRDPSEGNCQQYEICTPCRDHAHKVMREEFADDYD